MAYLESSEHSDPVRPGEQWFFYWKTSPSLWEGRIQQFPADEVIFIPLYWGLHGNAADHWDFGNSLAERDLLRLTQLLMQHGRRFCWLLPLTPAPFLPNGGVPAFSARTLAASQEGVHLSCFDQEGLLHKMYSFFEPRVWEAFTGFLAAFGQFLGRNAIKAPIWGTMFHYRHMGHEVSFHEDTSLAFQQGFSRFLRQNYPEGVDLADPEQESSLKKRFSGEVAKLFSSTAEAALGPFWAGVQNIVVLGSGPQETILRSLPGGKSQLAYTRDLFEILVGPSLMSSSLLSKSEKKETLKWILSEHIGPRELDQRYRFGAYPSELTPEFRPYGVVDIFGGNSHFNRTGLVTYLDERFRWLYRHQHELDFSPEGIDRNQDRIKIFFGEELTRTTFGQLLKLFLMGQRVFLDRANLPEILDKKLQVFLVENEIRIQSVNFITFIQICELGEGRLIIFDGSKLTDNPDRKKFWDRIFGYLNLPQPQMSMDEDVFSLWRIRGTGPHELSYLDVRRVNFYNPTSYKKTVSVKTQKHFAFMKMIDPTRAQVKSTPDGVEVELLPNGKIALDFGHYEEN